MLDRYFKTKEYLDLSKPGKLVNLLNAMHTHTLTPLCSATLCAYTPPSGAGLCAPPSECCTTSSCSTLLASLLGGWGTGARTWSPGTSSQNQGSRSRLRHASDCPNTHQTKYTPEPTKFNSARPPVTGGRISQ